jgi:hypothetical protein
MSSSKRLICKEILRQVFICLRPRTPYPTLNTVYVYTVYVLIHTGDGGGGGVESERGLEEQQFIKLGRKYQT